MFGTGVGHGGRLLFAVALNSWAISAVSGSPDPTRGYDREVSGLLATCGQPCGAVRRPAPNSAAGMETRCESSPPVADSTCPTRNCGGCPRELRATADGRMVRLGRPYPPAVRRSSSAIRCRPERWDRLLQRMADLAKPHPFEHPCRIRVHLRLSASQLSSSPSLPS